MTDLQPLSYERIWVALLEREWHTLAVVPSTDGVSASDVARGLARAGTQFLGEPLRLVSAETAKLADARRLLESLSGGALYGTVVATASPADSEMALLLVRHVDAVLLVVPLERARVADVRRLSDAIGRDRIIGALVAGA